MNDDCSPTSNSTIIRPEEEKDVGRLLLAAKRSTGAEEVYLLASVDNQLLVVATASSNNGADSIAFISARPDRFDINELTVQDVIGTSSGILDSPSSDDRQLSSVFCVPVQLPGGRDGALYVHVFGGQAYDDCLGNLEWLASMFSASSSNRGRIEAPDERAHKSAREQSELGLSLDKIPALAWICGSNGQLEEASQQWLQYTGITRDNALGWGFLSSFHPEDVDRIVTAWQELMSMDKAGGIEARIVRYDGEARYFMIRAVPYLSDSDDPRKWYALSTDIDDLKRAQFELAKSQAVMAEAQRIIKAGSWSWDMSSDAFTCSAECADIVGLPAVNINFETLMERVHPEDRENVAKAHGRALHGEALNVEHRFVFPDESVKFIHARGRLIFDDADKPLAYIGTLVDVTKARQSEEEIRRSLAEAQRAQASLAEAQKLSHVGSYRINAATGEVVWSDETYNIYSLDPAQPLTHRAIMERVHPDDRDRVAEMYQKGLDDRIPWEIEHRLLLPDGTTRHVHCVIRIEANAERELEVFGAIIDLTTRVKGEEDLRNAQADMMRMNRLTAMGALTVSIAHELNQPLMAIVTDAATCLSWLDRATPEVGEAKLAAERVIKEGKRAGNVLVNVRDMARNSRPSVEDVDINEVIIDVVTMLRGELRSRGINLTVSRSASVGHIRGDKVQLQQVLLNLILNAAEAMKENDRTIVVNSGSQAGRSVVVRVEDNGQGLDPNVDQRIFEAFFSTKPQGTGMGLAICQSIVQGHSGILTARPRTGGGAVFEFTIPYPREKDEPKVS